MKFRAQGSSIRLRLNRKEVEQFGASGRVTASVDFGAGTLAYTLARVSSASSISAAFDGSEVLVTVPDEQARQWTGTEQVGMRASQPNGLEIIIEKDFQCLHKGEAGKDPDAYPNPDAPVSAA